MGWFIRFLMLSVLTAMALQDFKSRSVYWFWFPLLVMLFLTDRYITQQQSLHETGLNLLMNIGFLLLQLVLVSLYFSVKKRQPVNITRELLGWGDILFLVSVACYFSFLNYLFFYIFSLILILCIFILRSFLYKKYELIPLAGIQAAMLIVCLMMSWLIPKINLCHDEWLQQLLYS